MKKTTHPLRKTLRILIRTILVLVSLVLLYLAAAFLLSRITVAAEPNAKDEVAIYIKTNGVHTDIVMPVRNALYDWSNEVLFENTTAADTTAKYVGLGWGDKGFYLETPTWGDLKASVAFEAAFALGNTAIHATFYNQLTEGESCKKILVSNEQYQRLVDYITSSFQTDASSHFINIKTTANYSDADAFYEANGAYSLFHTCNTWSNNALKRSGQKACLWTVFDKGIFWQYRN